MNTSDPVHGPNGNPLKFPGYIWQYIITLFDRFCARVWTSSQGDLSKEIYYDLIEYLYVCHISSRNGSIGLYVLCVTMGYYSHIPTLYWVALLLVLPISYIRYFSAVNFIEMPEATRRLDLPLHEARYTVLSTLYLTVMSLVSVIIMIHGQVEDKYAMAIFCMGNAFVNSTRNASMRSMVNLHSLILLVPSAIGLFCMAGIMPKMEAVLIYVFSKGVREIEQRIKKDTLDARLFAFREQMLARYDHLTGLTNRRYFNDLIAEHLARELPTAILYMDLDRFKAINDTMGHPAGDQLLKLVADGLRGLTDPNTSTIARFGGDEFVIMTTEDPMTMATRIAESFDKPFTLDSGEVYVGCSIGINTTEMSPNAVDLVKNADMALYAAKAKEGNSICVFDATMELALTKKLRLEINLQHALDIQAIIPHYQPIVDMKTNMIVSAEALARWNDPELGSVRPDIFIKMAESLGLIEKLGETILMRACKDAATWDAGIPVAVNVSAIQFKNPNRLKAAVYRALRESGLPGHRLELEITEGTMIDDFTSVQQTIIELKKAGVRFALDDFGSGYSSLTYIEQIPFDKIKIDRALMLAAMKNRTQEIVIEMVTKIAHEMDTKTVVEGIESHDQLFRMLNLGASQAQGFLFGRPSENQEIFRKQNAKKFEIAV